jgi:signal transduction histidine kinase
MASVSEHYTETLTYHAPPERDRPADVARLRARILEQPLVRLLLDAVPESIMILNQRRQIVLVNRGLLNLLGEVKEDRIVGLRPGEALNCIHAHDCPSGCGTSEFCRNCGAVEAILESQHMGASARECRITIQSGETFTSLELLVWAHEIPVAGESLTLFASQDQSHEKRRRALERIFFHDVLNTAGGIRIMAGMLKEKAEGPLATLAETLNDSANILIQEISSHRQLLAAESGELAVNLYRLEAARFLVGELRRWNHFESALGKSIVLDPPESNVEFVTDPSLLGRVMGNLVKNALEASMADGRVRVGVTADAGGLQFYVHNAEPMPRPVELQVFQRSFSTKGMGRGLGTYSVKLLAERYLSGRVSFTTSPDEGTTFSVWMPYRLDEEA